MNIPAVRRFAIADAIVLAAVVALFIWLGLETRTALNYNWNWSLPLGYLFSDTPSGWSGGLLLSGVLTSLRLLFAAGALALVLGVIVALLLLSPLPPLVWCARLYVESLRHLPPIVFMFIFFYFISPQLFGESFWRGLLAVSDNAVGRFILGEPGLAENLVGGILCLAIFEAAFVAEIVRAGILSIDAGQREAARALGLSPLYTLRHIILPQAFSRIAAPLVGQLVLLVKDSAILSVISVQELTFSAQETAVSTQQIFETWLIAAALYFALCAPILWLGGYLERGGGARRSHH